MTTSMFAAEATKLCAALSAHSKLLADATRVEEHKMQHPDGTKYTTLMIVFREDFHHWKKGKSIVVIGIEEGGARRALTDLWIPSGCLRHHQCTEEPCIACDAIRECAYASVLFPPDAKPE